MKKATSWRHLRPFTVFILLTLLCAGLFALPAPALAENQTTSQTQASYRDISASDPNYVFINYLKGAGITSGFPDGTYRPSSGLTRAEAAAILVKAAGLPTTATNAGFKDVSSKHWASAKIAAAKKADLLKGYPDGTFRPNARLTRVEGIALILKLSKQPDPGVELPTLSDVNAKHWAARPVAIGLATQMVGLASDNKRFLPNAPFTRGSLARALAILLTEDPDLNILKLTTKLTVDKGSVAVTRAGSQAAETIKGTTEIKPGDTVALSEAGSAEITFPDGSGLRLADKTELVLKETRGRSYIKKDGTPGVAIEWLALDLKRGKMFGALATVAKPTGNAASRIVKAAGNRVTIAAATAKPLPWWQQSGVKRTKVKVDMPTGVAAIRGTFWQNIVNMDGSSSTSLLTGSAEVTAAGQTVDLTAGQRTEVANTGAPPAQPAPLTTEDKKEWVAQKEWAQERAAIILQNQEQALPPPPPVDKPNAPVVPPGQTQQPDQQKPPEIPSEITNVIQNALKDAEKSVPSDISTENDESSSGTSDTIAPTVSSTDPADKATAVPLNKTINIYFSEIIQKGPAFNNITLKAGTTVINYTYNLSSSILAITPVSGLSGTTAYSVYLPAGAVIDLAGNALSAFSFGFTSEAVTSGGSGDTVAPTVSSTDPVDGATSVPVDQTVNVTFSENIQQGPTFNDITFKAGTTVINFTYSLSSSILYMTPVSSLSNSTAYTVYLPPGAVQDPAGNTLGGVDSFSFTTVAAASATPTSMIRLTSVERVNLSVYGAQANNVSNDTTISSDGRYVTFMSTDPNLVPNDTNNSGDIFVRDRLTGTTERINIRDSGGQSAYYAYEAVISGDGRYVAFKAGGDDLVTADKNGYDDIFVRDRQTGTTVLISKDTNGNPGNSGSGQPVISANGRYVAFNSLASNLTSGDAYGSQDVFVHDRDADNDGIYDETVAGAVYNVMVNVSSDDVKSDSLAYVCDISADGRFVVFSSSFSNLGTSGYYVRDLVYNTTTYVAPDTVLDISSDGRYIAFNAFDNPGLVPVNLPGGDHNGFTDVFIRDRDADGNGIFDDVTSDYIVSISSTGTQANNNTSNISVSDDGRYAVFSTKADNLVPDDTYTGIDDVFIHDRQTGITKRISTTRTGSQGDNMSYAPFISSTGQFVSYVSDATNLVTGDTNNVADAFVVGLDPDSPPDTTAPTSPAGLNAETGPIWVNLTWSPATDNILVARYEVYRSASLSGPYAKVADVNSAVYNYFDTTLSPNTTCYYYVLAADEDGNTSLPSASLTVTTTAVLAASPSVVPVAAGYNYSTVRINNGTVWSWGSNSYGRLGDGTSVYNQLLPVEVAGPGGTGFLSDVAAVDAYEHTVAVKSDGTVWTWGKNDNGQLGINSKDTLNHPAPAQVVDQSGSGYLTGINAVSAGQSHSLALASDGTVWAWGTNGQRQLGQEYTTVPYSYTPLRVRGPGGSGYLTGVKAIAAGAYFSVALKTDGTVWVWGSCGYGLTGDGTSGRSLNRPVMVPGLTGVTAIAAGDYFIVALKNDGSVWGWGDNYSGQLGDGTDQNQRHTPVQVKGPGGTGFLTSVAKIAAGPYHTAALTAAGYVYTFGNNSNYQLGTGDGDDINKLYPTPVVGPNNTGILTGIDAIDANSTQTLVLMNDGTFWTWGYNSYGELGAGISSTGSPIPIKFPDGSTFNINYTSAPFSSFQAAANSPVENSPYGMALEYLNGDSNIDLVVVNSSEASNIGVYLGNGDGTFQNRVTYQAGNAPRSVAVADFNLDGVNDIATANWNSGNVSVLMGNSGTWSVQDAVYYPVGINPSDIVAADFRNDTCPDLAVINRSDGTVSILLNNGTGVFVAGGVYATNGSPYEIVSEDFNQDGKLDLAIADYQLGASFNNITILLGTGDGGFTPGTNLRAQNNPTSLTTGDFNGDGKADLAVVNQGSNSISVFLGNVNDVGTFLTPVTYNTLVTPDRITASDFNGDGWTDLAVTLSDYPTNPASSTNLVSIFQGNGNGTFRPPVSFDVQRYPWGVAGADLNGDGKPDLIVSNITDGSISVLLNDTPVILPNPRTAK